jgi:hypothetical protein
MASKAKAPATYDDASALRLPAPVLTRPAVVDKNDGSALELETLPSAHQQFPPTDKKDGHAGQVKNTRDDPDLVDEYVDMSSDSSTMN